ncbi:TPA: hypothetical protein ACWWCX_002694 [Enterococcus faecium]
MFTREDGAGDIINDALEKYEKHFNVEFPLYEYISMTESDRYDFSVDGAKRLSKFIDERIATNTPVKIPEGYNERIY